MCFRHLKNGGHPAEHKDVDTRSSRTTTAKQRKASAIAERVVSDRNIQAQLARPALLSQQKRKKHDRRYMLMCVSDLRPFSMNAGEGFELFVGGLSAGYAAQRTHQGTLDKLLNDEYVRVQTMVQEQLNQLHTAAAGEAFCSFEVDMTTTANTSYCTFSINYISEQWTYERLNLCTREFPLDHKAVQVTA